jgi:hypothetical protein
VLALLRRVDDAGHHETARRAKQLISFCHSDRTRRIRHYGRAARSADAGSRTESCRHHVAEAHRRAVACHRHVHRGASRQGGVTLGALRLRSAWRVARGRSGASLTWMARRRVAHSSQAHEDGSGACRAIESASDRDRSQPASAHRDRYLPVPESSHTRAVHERNYAKRRTATARLR